MAEMKRRLFCYLGIHAWKQNQAFKECIYCGKVIFTEIVTKPFTLEEFQEVVNRYKTKDS